MTERILHPNMEHATVQNEEGEEEEVEVPMYIVASSNMRYITGVVGGVTENDIIPAFYPLVLKEAPSENGVVLGFLPPFLSFGLLEAVMLRIDMLYTLMKGNARDEDLVRNYGQQLAQFLQQQRVQDTGIVAPSNEDVVNINKRR